MKKYILFISILINLTSDILIADDFITLDLNNPTNPTEFIVDEEKGHWVETYNNAEKFRQIEFGLFSLTHIPTGFGGTNVGGGMAYWDGFTYCTSGDTNDYGLSGNSNGWLTEQWGCMAGGGIMTDENKNVIINDTGKVQAEKVIPYLVAYWGYWVELNQQGDPCLQVNFNDGKLYEPVGIYINNHPWPYYGNMHGDGFASPFTKEGDFFKLYIHGFNENKEDIGIKIEHTLAEFKNGKIHQSSDWEWIDLSELGEVSGIYFTMESTDLHANVELGPNTAVYFCMDKLTLKRPKENTKPSRPAGLKATSAESSIHIKWNASNSSVGVKGYNLYLNGGEPIFTNETEHNFNGLLSYTDYKIEVQAVATDNSLSSKASVTIKTADETPPTVPTNLQGIAATDSIALTWTAATDNVAVTEYHIYVNNAREKRVYTTNYTIKNLEPSTSYFIEVEARDAAGNRSQKASVTVVTEDKKVSLPSVEGNRDIFYNPDTETIHIQSSESTRIEVFDIKGSMVLSRKLNSGENQLSVKQLPKGIYLIKKDIYTFKINK